MSLVSEAGSMRSSGFSATSTWPLDRSPSSQARAPIGGDCGVAAGVAAMASAATRPSSSAAVLLMARGKKRSALSHYENGLERELGLDALRDGARGIAAEVRTDLQSPKVPAHQHPRCVLQPGRLATHLLLQRLGVLSRAERAQLQIHRL